MTDTDKERTTMKRIDIQTSAPYPVLIGSGLINDCGSYIRENAGLKDDAELAAVITDDQVGPLYAEEVCDSLESAGYRTVLFTVPNGEASKNIHSYTDILAFLAENHVTRSDFLVALGGGMIGDLAGFAAATYLRRIPFIQIPTTLLAAVDSSVGGKTGIDLDAGKNLAGAFYQPALVLCDLDTLDTLPEEVFRAGCAEVIKYGVLGDEKLFTHLSRHSLDFDREEVVARCIEMKRDIVGEDEFDNGLRQKLNLGHTLAHAAELLSNYELSHGMAVAIGLAVICRAAAANGFCSAECAGRVCAVLQKFGLPTQCGYTMDELYKVMESDKKRKGGSISLIVPRTIGKCEIRKMTLEEMRAFLEKGL